MGSDRDGAAVDEGLDLVARRERRERRSREETRALLLQMGALVVRDEGLGAVTFKKVFDRLEKERGVHLTNASVIGRVWRNQADFRADVLVAVALEENEAEIDRTLGGVGPTLAEVDRSTPEARRAAMRELCRLGGAANLQAMRESTNWPLWISAWDLAVSSEDLAARARVERALVAGYDAFNERIEEVYRVITELLGYRVRDSLTLRQFTLAVDALGQGCGLRDRIDSRHPDNILRPTGPGGEEQPWTLFGIAFEGLVSQFFELDPAWQPEEDSGGRAS